MRRKSDMWKDVNDQSFLPGESEQAARASAADVRERVTTLEDQLKSQFTSMAAYHQIAILSADTARAEARADLDREKATLISLVERVRDECAGEATRVEVAATASDVKADPKTDAGAASRISGLEDRLEQLGHQVSLCLRSQQELANSISFMFEQQMRNAGFVGSCAGAAG